MKVVVATHYPTQLDSPRGGVEAVSVVLADALASLPDLEVNVVALDTTVKNNRVFKLKNGVIIHRIAAPAGSMLISSISTWKKILQKFIIELSPDIVHAHDTYGLMTTNLDIPRVFTMHGFIHRDVMFSKQYFPFIRSHIWRFFETASWASHPNIIAINKYVHNRISPHTKGNIYDIENPIDKCFFNTNEGVKKDQTIFSSAVIAPRKNILSLINAFEMLLHDFPEFSLQLAGPITNHKYGEIIKKRINSNKLAGKVILLGQLNRSHIVEKLSSASIFALTSLEESAPLGISEALAVGTPVVTSDRCGMPYMIDHGQTGFLVDPLNVYDIYHKFRKLLNNKQLRKHMGTRAKNIAHKIYEPTVVAEKTRNVYLKILQSNVSR
ncbi:glycosyltransferase family 4 protein [Desulfopila aestuarii]|uniref:Glycosyltransferase involved in cell wall bisynthesis n=1 Tax=Desulfopila aestuarii DSM 18488 TaxID=1121416 RepID=A0A1M7YFR9_9BACT|nr:glycosyltransferase family 4 protein [Desulfopila aestuarii]SHO51484.1 Glycosyltransferase involved in cell wall bisynthesis [Desulfopila aestuarii DSM 18488]